MSRRIWAWMVASKAVVGSSAMRSSGSQAMAMAIITPLPQPPGELPGVGPVPGRRVGDAHLVEEVHRPGLGGLPVQPPVEAEDLRHLPPYGGRRG